MAAHSIQPGAVIDGFTIGEQVHSGGMATLWSVTHPGISVPILMKVPRVSEGEDPAAIVSFEMEQMILPRLSGPHVPQCFGTGDFARQAYVVMERIPGQTLYKRLAELPLAYEEARAMVPAGADALFPGDVRDYGLIGTPDTIGARLARYEEAGVQELAVNFIAQDPVALIRRYASEFVYAERT